MKRKQLRRWREFRAGGGWIPYSPVIPFLLAGMVLAGPIVIPLIIFRTETLTDLENAFVDGNNPSRRATQSRVVVAGPNAFDVDFSALGERIYRITWRAPEGSLFEIRSPASYGPASVTFQFRGGTSSIGPGTFSDPAPTILVNGARGSLPDPTGSVVLSGPQAGAPSFGFFISFQDIPAGRRMFLESVSLTTTVPSSYAGVYNAVPVSVFMNGEAEFFGSPSAFPPHAGQWIRIVTKAAVAQEEAARERLRKSLKRKIRKLQRQIRKEKKGGDRGQLKKLKRKLKSAKRRLRSLQGPFP